MTVDGGQRLNLELTSTIEVRALPRWQEVDRRSALAFLADRRLVWAIAGFLLLVVLTTASLTGVVAIVDDPDGALAARRDEGMWDFSVGLRLALDGDAPYVLELRKVGADEAIVVHLPAE